MFIHYGVIRSLEVKQQVPKKTIKKYSLDQFLGTKCYRTGVKDVASLPNNKRLQVKEAKEKMHTVLLDFIEDHIDDNKRSSPSNTSTEQQTQTVTRS